MSGMLNFVKVLNETHPPKKNDSTQQNLSSCNSNMHGANDQENSILRDPPSSRPISRKNSISSIQSQPNPVTTNQIGAATQRLQNLDVVQEILVLKNEIARLKDESAQEKSKVAAMANF